jgi:hypothetical protein
LERDGEKAALPQRSSMTNGDGSSVSEPSSVTGSITPNPLKTNGGDGGDGGFPHLSRQVGDGLDLPAALDRRPRPNPPALDPEGDSLDDFK